MLSEILTFAIFVLIGLEIREGLSRAKDAIVPSIAALGGMLLPAFIFLVLNPHSNAWATTMPTDVALAVGALTLVGKKANPAVRVFLLTLAVADDFLSLVVIGIFFRDDLHLSSAIYTLGAAAIGAALPFRHRLIFVLTPLITYFVIPIYVVVNLFSQLDLSVSFERISLSLVASRVIGKVVGITLFAYVAIRFSSLTRSSTLGVQEIAGVGFLAGMGLTVSLVIAEITLMTPSDIAQVRTGLLLAALISGSLGVLWLKRLAVLSSSNEQ